MNFLTMDLALESGFLAEAWILLILLAGAILLSWSFREKYLIPWIAGWTAFGAAKALASLSGAHGVSGFWSYAAFVVAVGLFSSDVFLYVRQEKRLWVIGSLLLLALTFGAMREIWFPGRTVTVFDFLSWRLVLVLASAQLIRFAWGRRNLGRWLLALTLPFLHFDVSPNPHMFTSFDILVDLLLGISMMMTVLDDSRVQIQRLHVLNLVTRQSANSKEFEPTLDAVLKELAQITGAKAAGFRVLEGDQLVLQSKSEWASTFDSIPDYILVHDQNYRIVRANRSLLGKLNLSHDAISGRTCESVLPAGTGWKGCPYCARTDWGVGEDPCWGGYSMVSTSVYSGEDASHDGKVHVIKDITEAKAAEERYASLFSQMHEGVFTSTPQGRIIDCTQAFSSMLGYSRNEEILPLHVAQPLYVDPAHREKFLSETSRHGFARNFEYRLRRKDGKTISVIESSFATRDAAGNIERYQGVVLDVTEMKRAEEEIRRRNRELYVLNNIAVTFNQSFDLDEILQLSMLQIVELLSTDTAGVYLFEEETSTLRRKASYGYRNTFVAEHETFT